MKTIDDALELRGRIFGAYEMAELEADPLELDAWLTFVVVGAGPTGVEMAGQIAELSRRTLKGNFRTFDPSTTRVVLLDAAGRGARHLRRQAVRPTPSTSSRAWASRCSSTPRSSTSTRDGIEVEDPDGSRRRIEARTKIWAAGVAASPLGRAARRADRRRARPQRAGRRCSAT